MITYNLAPVPLWVLRNNAGYPLANGYMKTFRNTVRSEYKAVYQNMGGTVAWSQPIVFNAAGYQGPFYWASDENYYLEIYDENDALVRTISDYNAPNDGGSTPVEVNVNFVNYIADPQFNYTTDLNYSPVAQNIILGSSNWYFNKNNDSATDEINIIEFEPGNTVPPYNPRYYFSYECAVAGSGETNKNIQYIWNDVYAFQGTEITIQFWGQSPTDANEIQLYFQQVFGTGGMPSTPVSTAVTTFELTDTWALYQAIITVPSIVDADLGTNNDSYCSIYIQMPFNAITTIQMTNFQVNDGDEYQPFGYVPASNAATLQFPHWESLTEREALPYIGADGLFTWESAASIVDPLIIAATFPSIPVSGHVSLVTIAAIGTPATLTMVQDLGSEAWINGGVYRPDVSVISMINAYFVVEKIVGGATPVTVQVTAYLNGVDVVATEIVIVSPDSGNSAVFTMTTLTPALNGSTDYISYVVEYTEEVSPNAITVEVPFIMTCNLNNVPL